MSNETLPFLFKRRLIWQIRRYGDFEPGQKEELLKAVEDRKWLTRLIKRTKQECGGPFGGNWLEWLKGLPWLQIIQIAISLLMFFGKNDDE